MYIGIKLKNELINRQLLILIAFSIIFVTLLNIFTKSMEAPTSFKVNIVDNDKTVLSISTVKAISRLSGVEVTKNDADIIYVINKGFGKYLKKGELTGLIEVKKNNFKQGTSFLNDRIATNIVRDYIYLNIYDKIKSENHMSFEEYEKNLAKTKLDTEILYISVNDRKLADNKAFDINFSSYIILLFILLVSISISISQTVRLNRLRNKGVAARLKLSGVNEVSIILSEILSASIKCIMVILPLLLFIRDLKIYAIAVSLFYINLMINLLLEKISKSEEVLVIALRSVMILFLGLGILLKFLY